MLDRFYQIGRLMLTDSDLHNGLVLSLDQIVEVSGAERGMIILFTENSKNIFESARSFNKKNIIHPEKDIPENIIQEVKENARQIILNNASEYPTFKKKNRIACLKISSIICYPLSYNNKIFGVVYLDNRRNSHSFKNNEIQSVQHFANFISLAAYRAFEIKQLNNCVSSLEYELRKKYKFEPIISHNPKIIEIFKLISQVADTDATILIQGKSGTGKELIAHAIHRNSNRAAKPFIAINCGSLADSLLESELFGHVQGAFTNAIYNKPGWIKQADEGTFFLDEVGLMSQALQTKMLRLLQTGEYSPVGCSKVFHCNIRLIAATNLNLEEMVSQGKFREDLYYRLNVINIEIPPLRDRRNDILLLAGHFLRIFSRRYQKDNIMFSKKSETILLSYDYPGNIRELEHIIQRAVLVADGPLIEPYHLSLKVCKDQSDLPDSAEISTFKIAKQDMIEHFEHDYIQDTLTLSHGNISQAAKIAGINVKNFYVKMKKYRIDPHALKD